MELEVSGVPFVVEVIRRQLARDLRVFTGAALAVFGLLVALLYRDLRLAAGRARHLPHGLRGGPLPAPRLAGSASAS